MNVNPDDDVASSQAFSQEVAQVPISDETAAEKALKRRTWKKPKDKPKRPLSSYNIFFQHKRSRIVDGHTKDASPEEIIRSIEGILSKSREKRRHRKTHGRISFGDLARTIADQWKTIDPKSKAIFDHYAEVDMRRYRKEIKTWREKKEREGEAASLAGLEKQRQALFMQSMNSSLSSVDSSESDLNIENLPFDPKQKKLASDTAWQPRKPSASDTYNSSFSSIDSADSEFSLEPLPLSLRNAQMAQSEKLNQQNEDTKPRYGGSNRTANAQALNVMGGSFGHSSLSSLQAGDPLLGFSGSQPSDYASQASGQASSMASGLAASAHTSNLSSSYASGLASISSHSSGFNASVGLIPPSSLPDAMRSQRVPFFDAAQFHAAYPPHANSEQSRTDLERHLGNMELERRAGRGRGM